MRKKYTSISLPQEMYKEVENLIKERKGLYTKNANLFALLWQDSEASERCYNAIGGVLDKQM